MFHACHERASKEKGESRRRQVERVRSQPVQKQRPPGSVNSVISF